MARRKTVNLKELIEEVNTRNRCSTCRPDIREGWNTLLESFLHGAGVYSGFFYLAPEQIPEGQLPGINCSIYTGVETVPCEKRFENTDNTRIQFYVHESLMK